MYLQAVQPQDLGFLRSSSAGFAIEETSVNLKDHR
jgi:hypothetical protein